VFLPRRSEAGEPISSPRREPKAHPAALAWCRMKPTRGWLLRLFWLQKLLSKVATPVVFDTVRAAKWAGTGMT
jgi:hypothetical protein